MGAVFLHLPGGSVGSSKVNLSKYLSTRAIGMCWIKKQRVLIPYLHWCVFYRRMNSLSEEWMVRDKYRRLQSSTKLQIHARVLRRHNLICLFRTNIMHHWCIQLWYPTLLQTFVTQSSMPMDAECTMSESGKWGRNHCSAPSISPLWAPIVFTLLSQIDWLKIKWLLEVWLQWEDFPNP